MTVETDLRLRSALDTNQRDREQMCLAVLGLDHRYSQLRPRHPHGGPDGGRDIEGLLDGDRVAFGAVGFANGANDSSEQKKKIAGKFRSDLSAALEARPGLKAFVFFSNLHFTIGEQDAFKAEAKASGIEHCDIIDRERLRIELDSPAGFFIRFQFLGIPLSPEEQASFLSRYGDRLHDVVATGFGRVEKTLNRVLFLQESIDTLASVHLSISLKKAFPADEIGHFRAYWLMGLRGVTHGIFQILAGSSDGSYRFYDEPPERARNRPGIGSGIGSGQWEFHLRLPPSSLDEEEPVNSDGVGAAEPLGPDKWVRVGYGGGVGSDPVQRIDVSYGHDQGLVRLRPRLQLRDLDECMFMPIMNQSLAEKVESFDVYANGYHLLAVGSGDFSIDNSDITFHLPGAFSSEELSDQWVRIRPSSPSSAFRLSFSSFTPKRLFGYQEVSGASPNSIGD